MAEDVTRRFVPGEPLPPVRPVDTPLTDHVLPTGVRITHVSLDPPIIEKKYLTTWQWDMLVSVAAAPDGYTFGQIPILVTANSEVGLVAIDRRDDGSFLVTITDTGRKALHRGWYPTG